MADALPERLRFDALPGAPGSGDIIVRVPALGFEFTVKNARQRHIVSGDVLALVEDTITEELARVTRERLPPGRQIARLFEPRR